MKHTARLPCGIPGKGPHGPRYIEFHKEINAAYVVNELGCTVSVFAFDTDAAVDLVSGKARGVHTLTMIQSISTVPEGFPASLNTCSRIALHPTQRFLFVGNRGHDSIAVFKVHRSAQGRLSHVDFFHTMGKCPRHFQFDRSGKWMVTVNQDTDSLAVFEFHASSGLLKFTGTQTHCPSPNFVCVFTPYSTEGGNDLYYPNKRTDANLAKIQAATAGKSRL